MTKQNRPTIGLCLICTGKYDIFMDRLLEELDANFFPDSEVTIYLFWDKPYYKFKLPSRFSIVCTRIKHKAWPFSTLYRYKFFIQASHKITTDYLFYSDVDMSYVGKVGEEILPNNDREGGLVGTGHCGFWIGGGAWCDDTNSTAYTEMNRRERYYAGGFQGGETGAYLKACLEMAKNIEIDEKVGIITIWHDEHHWNKYLSTRTPKCLTPAYCMVGNEETKIQYGLHGIENKIIALDKNHEELRSDNGLIIY